MAVLSPGTPPPGRPTKHESSALQQRTLLPRARQPLPPHLRNRAQRRFSQQDGEPLINSYQAVREQQ
jgi:hypothetical protein